MLTGLYPDTREAIPVTTAADLDEVLFANVQGCLSLKLAMDAAKKKVQGDSVRSSKRDVLCSQPSRECMQLWQCLQGPAVVKAPQTHQQGCTSGQPQGVSPARAHTSVVTLSRALLPSGTVANIERVEGAPAVFSKPL